MFGYGYALEHVLSYNAPLALPPEAIGPVAEGLRLNFFVTGGEVSGPRIRGKIRPGTGGDWLTVRTDGVAILDVRATLETHDGALIYLTYHGVVDGGPNGHQAMLAGQVPPDGTAIRVAPRFQTAHAEYQWLNRLFCVGIGEIHIQSAGEVRYDVYAVT